MVDVEHDRLQVPRPIEQDRRQIEEAPTVGDPGQGVEVGEVMQALHEELQLQLGLDPGQQFPGAKGLGDIVLATDLKGATDGGLVAHGRDEDDGDGPGALVVLQLATEFEAIDVRHHDVEQDQVDEGMVQDPPGTGGVGDIPHVIVLEETGENIQVFDLVVDSEDHRW